MRAEVSGEKAGCVNLRPSGHRDGGPGERWQNPAMDAHNFGSWMDGPPTQALTP